MRTWIEAFLVVIGFSLLAGMADGMGDDGHWLDSYYQQRQAQALEYQNFLIEQESQRRYQRRRHDFLMHQIERDIDYQRQQSRERNSYTGPNWYWDGKTWRRH